MEGSHQKLAFAKATRKDLENGVRIWRVKESWRSG